MQSKCIFLGYCEHAIEDGSKNHAIPEISLIGMKPYFHSICFPAILSSGCFIFAFNRIDTPNDEYSIYIRGDDYQQLLFKIVISDNETTPQEKSTQYNSPKIALNNEIPINCIGWNVRFINTSAFKIILPKPGMYDIALNSNDSNVSIGKLFAGKTIMEDITPERLAEIRKDPGLVKAVAIAIECTDCKSVLRYHAAIDDKFNENDSIDHRALPDHYACSCGNQKYDMTDTKKDMMKHIGSKINYWNNQDRITNALAGSINFQRKVFFEMLNNDLPEEDYQKYLSNNHIMLSIFAPRTIREKLSILGRFTTDFVLIDSRNDLVLVEIEKPSTRLMRKNGAMHSELTHAVNQVNQWLGIVENHRAAILDMWKIDARQVNAIRGAVIAGREHLYDREQLRVLKNFHSSDKVKFYSYDDLIRAVDVIVEKINIP